MQQFDKSKIKKIYCNDIKSAHYEFSYNNWYFTALDENYSSNLIKLTIGIDYDIENKYYFIYLLKDDIKYAISYWNAIKDYEYSVFVENLANFYSRFNDIDNANFFTYALIVYDLIKDNENIKIKDNMSDEGNYVYLDIKEYINSYMHENDNTILECNYKLILISYILTYRKPLIIEAISNFDEMTFDDENNTQEIYDYLCLLEVYELKDIINYCIKKYNNSVN